MSPSRGPPNRSPDPVYSAAARFFDLATVPEERKREEGAMRFGQSFVRVGFARESSARVRAEARPISRTTRLAVASASVETSTPRMRRRRRASPANERRARLRPRVQTAKPPVNEEKMWCSRAPSRKPFLKRRGWSYGRWPWWTSCLWRGRERGRARQSRVRPASNPTREGCAILFLFSRGEIERGRTVTLPRGGVAARAARGLLDVVRPTTTPVS